MVIILFLILKIGTQNWTPYPINYLNGVYITEEWSSKSDIGKIFNGHKFTINEYMQTEREYIDAVKIIMFS